jgi:adenine-specific DNA-methyltransferase
MNDLPERESTETTAPFIKNQEAFQKLFPGVIQDGTLDVPKLAELLNMEVSGTKDGKERFGLMWAGKNRAIEALKATSMAALVPDLESSISWSDAKNVFVEGDNLEVLKLLQNAYNDKIKLIYLDPPYNTGKDFIYSDDFSDPIKHYLEVTKQVDSSGNRLTSNPETSGRKHSNWLSMMHPRLVLARNLLRQDGILAISIDDNEVHNLRAILDDIFGPENFEGHIHWRRRHNQPNDPNKMLALVAEHILVYSRDKTKFKESGVGKLPLTGDFTNPDNDPRGPWASKPWKVGTGQNGSRYAITKPDGQIVEGEWMGDFANFTSLLSEGRIYFPNNGAGSPRKKYYKSEREAEGQSATNWWSHDQFGHNQGASKELENLFGQKGLFDNPKPTDLLRALIQTANVQDDQIVADFFAGSGSMAHAVILQNAEDGKNRKSLSVTLDELIADKEIAFEHGYRTISELCIRRIQLALESVNSDQGLRVFKLRKSNFRHFEAQNEGQLELFADSIDGELNPLAAAAEILLHLGQDLSAPSTEVEIPGGIQVQCGNLLVNATKKMTPELVAKSLEGEPTVIAFLEDAFSGLDSLKASAWFKAKQSNKIMKTF